MLRYLRPCAPIAADAVLPGDPGRALMLAQELLREPRMSNHHRGLWGYHGETASGRALTIQATGIGGPSGAAVLRELAALGVRRAIRVGTCVALDARLDPGALLVVKRAFAADGTSSALGAAQHVPPAAELTAALCEAAPGVPAKIVASADLLEPDARNGLVRADGRAAAVDLQSAPLFALGRLLDVSVASILTVGAVAGQAARVLADDALGEAERRMGHAAAAALNAANQSPSPRAVRVDQSSAPEAAERS